MSHIAHMSQQTQTILQVLAFLGTVGLTGAGTLAAVAFALVRRRRLATLAASGAATLVAGYVAMLLVLGAASDERVLGPGETKVFCEIDCHVAYTVTGVRTTTSIGGRAARGTFYLVTLRTTFDERTVSSRRGDAPLWPNPRRVRVVDARGHAWRADASLGSGSSLATPLRPGESYETTLAFDLPTGIDGPRLELTDADDVTRVLLGHENSPLHAKTLFALGRGFVVRR